MSEKRFNEDCVWDVDATFIAMVGLFGAAKLVIIPERSWSMGDRDVEELLRGRSDDAPEELETLFEARQDIIAEDIYSITLLNWLFEEVALKEKTGIFEKSKKLYMISIIKPLKKKIQKLQINKCE